MDTCREFICIDLEDVEFMFDVWWATDEALNEIFRPGQQIVIARDRILQKFTELADGLLKIFVVPPPAGTKTHVLFAHGRDAGYMRQLATSFGLIDPNCACISEIDVGMLHRNAQLRIVGADLYGRETFNLSETCLILSNISPRLQTLLEGWFQRAMFRASRAPVSKGRGLGHRFDHWDLVAIPLVKHLGRVGIALKHLATVTEARVVKLRPDDRTLDKLMDESIEAFAGKVAELPDGAQKQEYLAGIATMRAQQAECKRIEAAAAADTAELEARAGREAFEDLSSKLEACPFTSDEKAAALAVFKRVCQQV